MICSISPTTNHQRHSLTNWAFPISSSLYIPSLTKHQNLKILFNGLESPQHNNHQYKSSINNYKKLHLHVLIEHSKSHRVDHDKKKNYEKCIYRDTSNPIALYINCFICLCVLSCTYILRHKIKSMNYIEGPKHMIITLHNSPRRLACTCIINYNLYTDAIHELLCNIAVVLGMTLSPSTFMTFKNIRPLSVTASLITRLSRHLTSHH